MLTDAAIRAVKPAAKPQKLSDERALYLLVTPTGARLWRFKYRFGGKEKVLALGQYPDTPLKKARDLRDEARRTLANGIDPGIKRKAEKSSPSNTFKAVALELFAILRKATLAGENPPGAAAEVVERTIQPHRRRKARRREPISAVTIDTMERRLNAHVFPYIGERDVKDLTSPELLNVLRTIEARGTFELAHRVRSICSRVLRYGRATGRECEDVAADLSALLTPVEPEHMAAIIEPAKLGGLLRSIDGYRGERVTQLALKLVPLIFPRPIEFRTMEWAQLSLDGDAADWRVPWRRMKMRDPHIVPLSRQAVAILRNLEPLTGGGRYVFPNPRDPDRPMSENCLTAALRSMGYSGEEMTWHGFRATASTLLAELGWDDQWIEMQLAHSERNKSKKAYNHAKYLPQRRSMMQAYSDYLDALRGNKDPAAVRAAEEHAANVATDAIRLPQPLERFKQRDSGHAAISSQAAPAASSSLPHREHLDRCKRRALKFVDRGDLVGALGALAADWPGGAESAHSKAIELGMAMLVSGSLATPEKMRRFINAFG
jgi:integrase